MRVSTAFNTMLQLPGASVTNVTFGEAVEVTVRLRRRRMFCGSCERRVHRHHDRRTYAWRHLDLGAMRCQLRCKLRRVKCSDCGIVPEQVEFARRGSRHTRDFEDMVAYLAQQMAKTPVTALMRVAFDTIGKIVESVVADHLDEGRLDGLYRIGVDEVSYRKHHNYLTCVADHGTATIVWSKEGRCGATLASFFEELGEERIDKIEAVSIDMSAGYEKAIRDSAPQATVCFDPFHVCQLGSQAVDKVRRQEWNLHGRSESKDGRWVKSSRWSLLKAPDRQSDTQLQILAEIQQKNKRLYRSFLLKEELRQLYRIGIDQAGEHLDAWLSWASRSKLGPFVKLARTIRKHREGILAAVRLGLSNERASHCTSW